jgi:hypothetical protein
MIKKITLLIILLTNYISSQAFNTGVPEAHVVGIYKRDWIQVGQNMSGVKFYIDSKHEKIGRFRRTLEVESYARPISKGVMSTLMEKEFDCTEEKEKVLWIRYFSGRLADVEMTGFLDTQIPWKKVSDTPSLRSSFMAVCGKSKSISN